MLNGGKGGQGVEWLTESAVKISEIFLKLTGTAEIQCFVMSHTDTNYIKDSVNEVVNTLLFV